MTKEFDEWFDKSSSESLSGFDNEAQRRGFQKVRQRQKLAAKQELAGFELGEGRKAQKAAYDASNLNAVNIASTAASPQLLAQQRDNILNSIATHTALNGWGEAEVTQEKTKWLSAMHLQRIQNLVKSDAAAAKAYYGANSHEIDGKFHDQADKLLKAGEVKDGSFRLMLELEKFPGGLSAQTKELDRRAEKKEISVELRDAAVQRLEHNYAKRKAMQSEWEGNLLDKVAAFHVANPTASIHDLDPTLMTHLTKAGKLQQALNIMNGEVKSDFDTLMGLYDTARKDRKAFAELDLKLYRGFISRSDMARLEELKRNPDKLKDAATLDQQLSDAHDTLGFGTGDRKKKGTFDMMVREELDQEQKRLGKELGNEERRAIIGRMMLRGKKEGDIFFKSHYFEAKAEGKEGKFKADDESLTTYFRQNPADDAVLSLRFRQKKGRNPTPQELTAIKQRLNGQ